MPFGGFGRLQFDSSTPGSTITLISRCHIARIESSTACLALRGLTMRWLSRRRTGPRVLLSEVLTRAAFRSHARCKYPIQPAVPCTRRSCGMRSPESICFCLQQLRPSSLKVSDKFIRPQLHSTEALPMLYHDPLQSSKDIHPY